MKTWKPVLFALMVVILLAATYLDAQISPAPSILFSASVPSGACVAAYNIQNISTGTQYACVLSTWTAISGGGGGSGTVTSIGIASTDFSVSGSPVTTNGNITVNLNTTAATPATYGDATHVGQFTVDSKGRLTFAANVAVTAGTTQLSLILDFKPVVTSTTVATITNSGLATNGQLGPNTASLNDNATCTTITGSVASTDTVYAYMGTDNNRTFGVLSTSSITGCTLAGTGVPAFVTTLGTSYPVGSRPIGRFTVDSSLHFTAVADDRSIWFNYVGVPASNLLTSSFDSSGRQLWDVTTGVGGVALRIAAGSSALATSAISSASCATVVSPSAPGVVSTDTVTASFNGDPTAVTGYVPLTAGMLSLIIYPTADHINIKACNNTSSSITPGAITLNWQVNR